MSNKKTSRIIVLLIALGLIAPMSAWAGQRGHHRSQTHGHYSHYGYRSYGLHGYGLHGYGHQGYYGHLGYGHQGYYSHSSPRFYGPDGSVYRGVTSKTWVPLT